MKSKIANITRTITEKKHTIVCISPHLDDAILSAGAFLSSISTTNKIVNITVFTQPSNISPSLSVKAFLKQCQYPSAEALYLDRKEEDHAVFNQLHADSYHLNKIDALWRPLEKPNLFQKIAGKIVPEFLYTYPIYRIQVISGHVSKNDADLIKTLSEEMSEIVKKYENPLIFCPIGTGKNVDHILTRNLCHDIFPNTIYWEDFPYSLNHQIDSTFVHNNELQWFEHSDNMAEKEKLIKGYKTQVDALFPEKNIPTKTERFYLSAECEEYILSK